MADATKDSCNGREIRASWQRQRTGLVRVARDAKRVTESPREGIRYTLRASNDSRQCHTHRTVVVTDSAQ